MAGATSSADFPATPGAYDTTFNNGDAFLTKFNAAGSALVFSTLVGGSDFDSFSSVVLDAAGNAWLTGGTSSPDFPTTAGAPDSTFNGGGDATIVELNATGSALLFSTFHGGSNSEGGADIAHDPTGDVYITGSTFSQDFPATVGAFDRIWNGDLQIFWGDAFITKLDIDASRSTPPAPPAVPATPVSCRRSMAPRNHSRSRSTGTMPRAPCRTTSRSTTSSAFTAPLVRDVSVPTSVYVASDLGTDTHFWRVRGVNSAGVAGPFSAVRSFTPQAAPPPSQLSTIDLNPATVVGGNSSFGTMVMSTWAERRRGDLALRAATRRSPACPRPPRAGDRVHGLFRRQHLARRDHHVGHDHGDLQRHTRKRDADLHARRSRPTLQSVHGEPVERRWWLRHLGIRDVVRGGTTAAGAIVSLTSSNPTVAGVPASVTVGAGTTAVGFTVDHAERDERRPSPFRRPTTATTRTATVTVKPAAPPPPPPRRRPR